MIYNNNLVKSIPDNLLNKQVKITTDFHLVFPAAAGGNFLLNKLEGIASAKTGSNEFLSRNTKWFLPESLITDISIETKEDMIAYATKMRTSESTAEYTMSSTHMPPIFTAQLFDLTIKELFVVTIKDNARWLLLVMLFIKDNFVNDYTFKLVKIMSLINEIDRKNNLSWGEFSKMQHDLSKTWHQYGIEFGSPIQFIYLNWLKTNKQSPSPETFDRFLSAQIIKFYTLRIMGQDFKSHPDALAMLKTDNMIVNSVDYFDLFRNGYVPKGSKFENNIKRSELRDYFFDNCYLVKQLAHVLPPIWQQQLANFK